MIRDNFLQPKLSAFFSAQSPTEGFGENVRLNRKVPCIRTKNCKETMWGRDAKSISFFATYPILSSSSYVRNNLRQVTGGIAISPSNL